MRAPIGSYGVLQLLRIRGSVADDASAMPRFRKSAEVAAAV